MEYLSFVELLFHDGRGEVAHTGVGVFFCDLHFADGAESAGFVGRKAEVVNANPFP